MQHPDEGTIHAWLDGELSAEQAAAIEAHVAGCAECSAAVAEARGIIAASSRIVSALDLVPGGVIPAVPPRVRPWYASTQLRAAAAVLIVAGATLLVVNRQDTSFVETAARGAATPLVEQEHASAMTAPSSDTNSAARREATAPGPKELLRTPSQPVTAERDMVAERVMSKVAPTTTNQNVAPLNQQPVAALSGRVSGAKVEVRKKSDAQALADKPRERDSSVQDERRARLNSEMALDQVVVTGLAAVSLPELKAVRTDTIGGVRHTVYEVRPGVQITLTETQPAGFRQTTTANRSAAAGSAAAPAPPPAAAAAVSPQAVTSITWTDPATGRGYVLSGPVSKEELEAIRQRLQAQKR